MQIFRLLNDRLVGIAYRREQNLLEQFGRERLLLVELLSRATILRW